MKRGWGKRESQGVEGKGGFMTLIWSKKDCYKRNERTKKRPSLVKQSVAISLITNPNGK